MAWALAFILLLSAGYLLSFPLLEKQGRPWGEAGRRVTGLYVLLVAISLMELMYAYTGRQDEPIRQLATRFEFTGVNVTIPELNGTRGFARLTGAAIDSDAPEKRGFRWFALPSTAIVDVRPVVNGELVTGYRIDATGMSRVVRLNGVCVNRVVGGWVPVGGSLAVNVRRFESSQGLAANVSFGLDVKDGEVEVQSPLDHPNLDAAPLRINQSLGDVLGDAGATKLQAALKEIRDPEGRTVLDAYVVRRIRGHGDEALALVWDQTDLDTFSVTVSANRFDGPLDIPSNDGAYHLAVDDDTLVLPNRISKVDGGAAILPFRFRPARAYAMPPAEILTGNKRNLDFASVNIAPTGHGYLFDTGNLNFPILRRGTLAEDGASLSIVGGDVLPANKEIPLGAGPVAPVFCLRDPILEVGSAWMAPCAGIFAGVVLAMIGLVGFRSRLDPVEDVDRSYPAFVVWVGVVSLLTIRAVLSFRVSMLPPFNMSATASEAYRNAWPASRWLLIWVPGTLGLLVAVVTRVLGRGIPYSLRKKFKKKGSSLSEPDRLTKTLGWLANAFLTVSIAVALGVVLGNLTGFHLVRGSALLLGILLFSAGFLCLSFVPEAPEETNGDGADLSFRALLAKYPRPAAIAGALALIAIFFSVKLTLAILLLALAGLCFVERSLFPLLWRRFKVLIAGLCILAADPGSSLYAVPFLVALAVSSAVGTALGRQSTRSGAGSSWNWASLVPVLLAVAILVTPTLGGPLAGLGTTLVKRGIGGETGYRLVAADLNRAQDVLASPSMAGSKLEPQHLLGAMHQRWQMDEYVRGAGIGYFKSPLSGIGMTYPTLLADASFSSLLVAEHGDLAAWMAIGLHLLVAMALFIAAWTAAQSRRQKNTVRALYAFAGLFGFVGLYMALANLWALPFTGQNVPLLSLASGFDWLLYVGLSFLAIFLLAFPEGGRNRPDPSAEQRIRSVAWSWWSFPAGLGFGWIVLLVLLLKGKGDPTVPFTYPDATYEALQRTLGDAQGEQTTEETVPLASTVAFKQSAPMFQRFAAQFDAGSVTRTPIVLEPGRTRGLAIDRNRLRLTSPFVHDEGVSWHGNLVAQYGIKHHQLLIAGGRERFTFSPTGGSKHLRLGRPFDETRGRRIDFETQERVPGKGTVVDNYGGVELTDDDKIVVQWNDTLKPAVVRVNSARIDDNEHRYTLKPFDVVSLELRDSASRSEGFSLCYLGPSDDKLAQVVWRNGRFMRIFPQGSDFPSAYSIGQAGDSANREAKVPKDVDLSLNLALQRDLQKVLRTWGTERQRAVSRGAVSNEGLPFTAVCVLDSFSGQVRGLASIPQLDPNDDIDIQDGFDREHDAYIAARSSWAFVNRMVGSTIKPLSFSALATQLNRKGFEIGNLTVSEQAGVGTSDDGKTRYCELGDTHLKRGLTMEQNPRPAVSMFDFLRDSRTWPAVVVSSLGLRHGEGSPMAMLASPGHDVEYAGQWHKLGFRAATADDLFTSKLHLSSQALSETAYFRGLELCYSPIVRGFTAKRGAVTDEFAEGFLPFKMENVKSSEVRANALPEPHWADQTLLTDFDGQMVRYMIGSGECRWNALSMAANMARISTGYAVRPTLSTEDTTAPAAMPAPLDNKAWREAHLLAPLSEISTLSGASRMYEAARAAGFRLVMKTGTIDDGMRGPSSRESEMLMFTLGVYGEKGFVKGRTISGYISIRASKAEGGEMVKSELVARVLPVLIAQLKETKAVPSASSARPRQAAGAR